MITVYTDGACSKGNGGWGWFALDTGQFAAGFQPETTNQRMEMMAAIRAGQAMPNQHLKIVSDSAYVVNGMNQEWWRGWVKRGWRTRKGSPVANSELWLDLIAMGPRMSFVHVKGHSGNVYNDFVDELAVEARIKRKPRKGTLELPDEAVLESMLGRR